MDILGKCSSKPYDDEVITRAKKLAENAQRAGAPMLTEEALEKAKKELEEKRRAEVAKRIGLKASASYSMQEVNPFDVLGIPRPVATGWNRVKKVSDKMLSALARFKVPNADKLNFTEAQAILSECIRRAQTNSPSLAQERLLKKLGVMYPVRTFEEASAIISQKLKRR
jgi:hypothetical protein